MSFLLSLFSKFKIYLYAALLAAAITFWAVDRHNQFDKGVAYCQQQHTEADTKEIERQKDKQAEEAKKALQIATETAEHITSIQTEKPHEIAKTKELAIKANKPVSCDLSDDELRDFNEAISRANH